MLLQKFVTLVLKMTRLLVSRIKLVRRVLLTEIHSVQPIVVQLLGHTATSMGKSTRALFEGVLIAQVTNYKTVRVKQGISLWHVMLYNSNYSSLSKHTYAP